MNDESNGFNIYKDIAERTDGDIYIGIVGPVRTGKSTFIKRFMDTLILPNVENPHTRERAKDELPQSADGRTIMTTEPKFIPSEAVEITIADDIKFKMRLIDCVGYLVEGVSGHMEDDHPRMVSTPWLDEKIAFSEAAEIGTQKVITEHSTIGIVVTCDGSITEIERAAYVSAEERVIAELKALGKPFIMLLNTTRPYTPETETLRAALSEKHKISVLPVNCAQLKPEDITSILEKILYEFPVKEIRVNFPKWIETLPNTHWLKQSVISSVKPLTDIDKLCEIKQSAAALTENEYVKKAYVEQIRLGDGAANIEVNLNDDLFYNILSETTGMKIEGEYQLISTIKILAEAKKEYDKIKYALEEVRRKGYGVVTPSLDEMKLEAPVIVKHGSRYGVRIKASAPSIHLIKADIETDISPIVGTEKQSEELIEYLNAEMAEDASKIWELNMFGKSMHDLVQEGLMSKLYRMPEDAQMKLQETLQRVINEGSSGLICIIL
ncbi:stage IV sporulation protein A [Clostridia bacterium]|nr:stage IV sporulation protein A [Clostridia bacterium]